MVLKLYYDNDEKCRTDEVKISGDVINIDDINIYYGVDKDGNKYMNTGYSKEKQDEQRKIAMRSNIIALQVSIDAGEKNDFDMTEEISKKNELKKEYELIG